MNFRQRFFAYMRFLLLRMIYFSRLKAPEKNYFGSGRFLLKGVFELGRGNVLENGVDIEIKGVLKIGSRNYFNRNFKMVCYEKIEIGDDCLIADSVHIYDHDHRFADLQRHIKEQGYIAKSVKIGSNVWIGAKVTILKGVIIGDGAIIGANAVVNKDVPSNAIAAGNPARIVKMRANAR